MTRAGVHMPNMLCILTNGRAGISLLNVHVEGINILSENHCQQDQSSLPLVQLC